MKTNFDILSSILKTTQMGQVGIRAVNGYAANTDLKNALEDQLQEYNNIEHEAYAIAATKGWEMNELDPVAKTMSKIYTHTNLKFGRADSKIAAMMIQGNTRGMIKGLKNLHNCPQKDHRIQALSQKLLDCENANIKQMQGYL